MSQTNPINTFSSGRPFLHRIHLFNRSELFVGPIQVPTLVTYVLIWFPTTYVLVMTCWNLFDDFDFSKLSLSLAIAILISSTLAGFSTLASNTAGIAMTIDHMQDFIQNRCETSRMIWEIYNKAERKHTCLFKGLEIYLYVALISAFTIPIVTPLCYALFGFPQPQQWFMPIDAKSFLEIDTAFGYYATLLPMMLHGVIYIFASNGILGIFISLYFYIDAACIDFQYSISNIDTIQVEISALDGKSPAREMRKIAKRKMHFIEIVSLHRNINDLMANTEAMMTGMIFFQLLCSVMVIALILFSLNFGDCPILTALNVLSLVMMLCYVYCYFAERVTEKAYDISDIVYESLWYKMPPEEQQLMRLIIVRAQKTFLMTGFGLIECSLGQLLTIIRSAASYFLILRQLK